MLRKKQYPPQNKGQSAIEYLLLLGVVAGIILVGFRLQIGRVYNAADNYFVNSVRGIYGAPPNCRKECG